MSIITNQNHFVGPESGRESEQWRRELSEAVGDAAALAQKLKIPTPSAETFEAARRYRPLAPQGYLDRMTASPQADRLLLQVVPDSREIECTQGFTDDPTDDQTAELAPGLIQKYSGRLLVTVTDRCAIHCRFCFRRHRRHPERPDHPEEVFRRAAEWLRSDRTIDEVILSGGDPLVLEDGILQKGMKHLEPVPHLRRIRIHTRVPVVLPSRITPGLVELFRSAGPTVWTVVHINHPDEADRPTLDALSRLIDAGLPVLAQGVLLRGVNDSPEILERLYRRLIDHRITPYYLHQLDRVTGAAHFEVPPERGLEIVEQLRRRLPGYAVPAYVYEVPGRAYKQVLG